MSDFILTGFADEIGDMMSEQYNLLHKLGIKHIELRGVNGKNISTLTDEEVTALKAELDSEGIKISAIGSPIGKIKITDSFDDEFEKYKKIVRFAKILDTKYIRMFSFFTEGENEKYRDEVFARLTRLIAYAKSENVILLHENEKDIYGDIYERCVDIFENLYCDNFKCTFDFANFVQVGTDTLKAYDALKGYIEYVHIKDALYENSAVVPAGYGDGNIEKILAMLKADGYKGFVSLEPHLSHFAGFEALEGGKSIDKTKKLAGDIAYTTAYNALKDILNKL